MEAAGLPRGGGYKRGILEACRSEFSFDHRDLQLMPIAVAERGGKVVGVAQVKVMGDEADYVAPSAAADRTIWTRD